jgi:two-component system, sensor histidine kinase LadS
LFRKTVVFIDNAFVMLHYNHSHMEATIRLRNTFNKEKFVASSFFNKLFTSKKETEAETEDETIAPAPIIKKAVDIKKDELHDSIIYAKRIQEGMMLKEKHLFRLFEESFILFQPKDIVSGDFYWFTKIDNKILVAVADCTGHGIPGAFMSVLGISLLNQIIIEEKNTDVSLILQRLDHKLKKAFSYSSDYHEEDKHPYDGMDIGLCCIDSDAQELTFAGAFRSLYHIANNNTLTKLEGARYPIGGLNLETKRIYESSQLKYTHGDKVYLTTDGFADQFGGPLNKKFMIKKFKDVLLKTASYSMKTQQLELSRVLNEWKSHEEQTDDILIIGVQL